MHLTQQSCCLLVLFLACLHESESILQPRESEIREIKDLSGMWWFRADDSPTRDMGFQQQWYTRDLKETGEVIPMPVPASYNDITTDAKLRDFVGWVWYETKFYVSSDWFNKRRTVLRFGSAHYNTIVYLNSKEILTHSGGHLPFETDVSKLLVSGELNRLTVAVNNTLTPTTLPPGTIEYKNDTNKYPPGYFVQNLQMDFFNYAGIHRPVLLYTTPQSYISDIIIKTNFLSSTGFVTYKILTNSSHTAKLSNTLIHVSLLDADLKLLTTNKGAEGLITVKNVNLWWPHSISNKSRAYLYTLQVSLLAADGTAIDIYREPFGIRTVNVTNKQLLINNRPFYCHGVAKHEDSDLRGKGVDLPLIARDFNLLRWLGANCFRTSHYPYAEEIMDEADRQGVVVIDESPGVGIKKYNFGNVSLAHHKSVMRELVSRDKNRPSVIMWSVANEPASSEKEADYYFREVINTTRQSDDTRPVTFVIGPSDYWKERAAQYVDILCINHYYAWYSDMGHIEVVGLQLKFDLDNWYKTFNKPIIMTEYGADTISGFHSLPSSSFTEEYQVDFLKAYHNVFDILKKDYFVGEMVWNFADFMTVQDKSRAYGNRKGLFTRQRQPKPAAFLVRDRYHKLANNSNSNSTS